MSFNSASNMSTQENQQQLNEVVQPLHQEAGNIQRPIMHRQLLETRTNFASPTDNLMSPCTAKLQAHKKKHFAKSKPQLLRFNNLVANKENANSSFGLSD
ncbi:hypothetical protein V1511DRAFT_510165 [Dipodascopsis uninucleata]